MANYAQPVLKKNRWFTVIWSIPLLTAVIASFLLFNYYQNRGLPITIDFANGHGIVAGKTKIRYEGIDVGLVDKVTLLKGESKVRVHARLNPSASHLASRGTLFWVVQARFSSGNISGLDTILSGKYISMRPLEGSSVQQSNFTGLNEPPMGDESLPGLFVALNAKELGSLSAGTPVLYKQIKVGRVEGHELLDNNEVKIFLYIEHQFAHLVRTTSRFWNAGGIRITGGLSGIKVQTESVVAMLAGGVTFDTSEDDMGNSVERGHVFPLHHNREEALSGVLSREDEAFQPGIIIDVSFKSSEGVIPGKTEVKFKGIAVGKVLDRTVADDLSKVYLKIMLHPEAEEACRAGANFWVVKPAFGSQGISGLSTVLNGRYIEVRPGTGERLSEFTGLEKPPLSEPDEEGVYLRLASDDAGAISAGSPLLYRHVEVGKVLGVSLAQDGSGVDLVGLVYADQAHLVKDTSRFWNSSGLSLKADMSGVKMRIGSLASLLSGGIEFETPQGTGEAIAQDTLFTLYPDLDAARKWGKHIEVHFENGDDIKAGAPLRYRGVEIGEVKAISLNKRMDGVVVDVYLNQDHEQVARSGTRFWVVRSTVGLMAVEHLDTIIRGGYLEVEPGAGDIQSKFIGLETPPEGRPGSLALNLHCSRLGSLRVGSPLFYRNIQAGAVQAIDLNQDGTGVDVRVLIDPLYARLVGDQTLFYRSGGVGINASLYGIEVNVESLAAILTGGISFANKDDKGGGLLSSAVVTLFPTYKDAVAAGLIWKEFMLRARQTGSLTVGRPVYYRGVPVGEVLHVALGDYADHVAVTVGVESRYESLVRKNSLFWNASGIGLDMSLFGGAKMRTQSLDAILSGGVAFINPEDVSELASAGTVFTLHDEPKEKWLLFKSRLSGFNDD